MFHTMLETLAVLLAETGPSLAVAGIGPQAVSVRFSTHIHTGRPTSPTRLGPGSGTMPILIGSRSIDAIARLARTTGSIVTVPFWIQTGSHEEPGGGQ